MYYSELIEQCQQLTEKSNELKLNLEQVYDELRSQIGDVRNHHEFYHIDPHQIIKFSSFFHAVNF